MLEARWYDLEGKLLHTLDCPFEYDNNIRAAAVTVDGKPMVALSCWQSQCIWLGSRHAREWTVAWQASGEKGSEERKGLPRPTAMCQGKAGQIIAQNGCPAGQGHRKSVSVFDTTQIPFRLVVLQMKLDMDGRYLCYYDLPGIGATLAATDNSKLAMFIMDSEELMNEVGVKELGTHWEPKALCSDERGRLYVADQENNSIIVMSAQSGAVLQQYKLEGLEKPQDICWHEGSKSIIVGTHDHKIGVFHIEF